MAKREIKKIVKQRYADIATQESRCCGSVKSCCGGDNSAEDISKKIGYSIEELKVVPEGANLGLGCGNPLGLASLKENETVLDLGSGAGFDCFLAAHRVGKNGKVIGIDMTPEMVDKARENAKKGKYDNVEFRLGEIENLPVEGNLVDMVISNCVINLSPDKRRVFKEAFRVLKPGGRLMVSDIVLLEELPDSIKDSVEAYVGCISGAIKKVKYMDAIQEAGFQEAVVLHTTPFSIDLVVEDMTLKEMSETLKVLPEQLRKLANSVESITVYAIKPASA